MTTEKAKQQLIKTTRIRKIKPNNKTKASFRSPFTPSGWKMDLAYSTADTKNSWFLIILHCVHKKNKAREFLAQFYLKLMKFYKIWKTQIPSLFGTRQQPRFQHACSHQSVVSRHRLSACVMAHGGHFKHILWCFRGSVCQVNAENFWIQWVLTVLFIPEM